jgi:hypothetical protein
MNMRAVDDLLSSPGDGRRSGFIYVRFEVFTAVTMKNGVFWDVPSCGSCKNRSYTLYSLGYFQFRTMEEVHKPSGSMSVYLHTAMAVPWPCRSSGSYSLASHRGDPGSSPV